ncbi:MAG: oxidoreductase [Actinomyces sp.]|nr:MAG: oxidoreductase [Actinomyces sp.]
MAIVSYVPKETWVTRGDCNRYHVIVRANETHSPAISPHEPAATTLLQVGRIVD